MHQVLQSQITAEQDCASLLEKFSQYYLKTGTFKYGSTCKYHHPKDRNGAGPVSFNVLGLPMRQILDWLSHSPTDIEGYIRPGCIILTIYLRLGKPRWELYCDLGSSLTRFFDDSNDPFWRTRWLYARVQHSLAFVHNGQVV